MSLIDRQTLLSDRQAVTVTAFTSDCYDTGNISPSRNLGRLGLRGVVTTQIAAAGAGASVKFELGHADAADGTGFVPLIGSDNVGVANLGAGSTPFDTPIPDTSKRFVMGRYTVTGGPLTAGQFSFALMRGSDSLRAYPDAYTQAF